MPRPFMGRGMFCCDVYRAICLVKRFNDEANIQLKMEESTEIAAVSNNRDINRDQCETPV